MAGGLAYHSRVLLDTNIVIALFGSEPAVVQAIEAADVVVVPAVVLGELFFGARQSRRAAENLERLREFAEAVPIVTCDAVTAEVYGEVKTQLRAKGTPIPENDVWIAALARQHELPLATRDAHVDAVPDLVVVRW